MPRGDHLFPFFLITLKTSDIGNVNKTTAQRPSPEEDDVKAPELLLNGLILSRPISITTVSEATNQLTGERLRRTALLLQHHPT